jgi:hypothetical protein
MLLAKKAVELLQITANWVYVKNRNKHARANKRVHIIFCICDHYEPATGNVDIDTATRRVDELLDLYPKIANKYKDSDGVIPKRTWFFPPHYHRNGWLRKLVFLCERGYGEIELHLHHGKVEPDTSDNLRATLLKCIDDYSIFGIFGEKNGVKRYGFIHGDWALDNSRHGKYCGVNDELTILQETGCYADFTFPCRNEANPVTLNSIYYATDDPCGPKSHNKGVPVCVNGREVDNSLRNRLMIIEGPIHPLYSGDRLVPIRIMSDAIDNAERVSKRRMQCWEETGISVIGKEEWIIIKTHMHGASDGNVSLGSDMDELFGYFHEKYNNNHDYALHYVTARELYNIIKAAEAGESGDNPAAYRNYEISVPRYDSSPNVREASGELMNLVAKSYRG